MENLINFLMTPNEMLCNLLQIPLGTLDVLVTMLLFTTILNITCSKKQKLLYVVLASISFYLLKLLLPNSISLCLCLLLAALYIYFIFKISKLKTLFSVTFVALGTAICESIIILIISPFLETDMNTLYYIPLSRLLIQGSSYLLMYIIYKILRFTKFNFHFIESMPKKTKLLIIINSIAGILAITPNLIFINEYIKFLPKTFIIYTVSAMITFFFISLYTTFKSNELAITKQELENSELYNKTLNILYDNIRTFKHDFNNMVQIIGGYIASEDVVRIKSILLWNFRRLPKSK